MARRADLAGSVRQKAATCSPDASLGRYLAFCSSLPAKMMPWQHTWAAFSGGKRDVCEACLQNAPLLEHASFTQELAAAVKNGELLGGLGSWAARETPRRTVQGGLSLSGSASTSRQGGRGHSWCWDSATPGRQACCALGPLGFYAEQEPPEE